MRLHMQCLGNGAPTICIRSVLRRVVRLGPALIAAVIAAGGSGCGSDGDRGDQLTVSAASSLTEAFQAYGDELGGAQRFSFAGSDELAAQIRQGARPDVFASANTTYPEELAREGLVEKPVVFARNQLVLAVPADSEIQSIDDLAEPGVDLVIAAEAVPVGHYTRELLGRLPASEREAILANVRSQESDVKGVLGKVAQRAADAGFVYTSDVAAAGTDVREIEIPRRLEPEVAYGIAVVVDAPNPEGAQAFVDGLLEGDGARALAEAGFLRPP
jgi:molybdate transport system substrate-binding protein